jgi:uncharacterized protein (TIGR01777 family)
MPPLETRAPDISITRVAITGASGFLGSGLAASLQSDGLITHRVRRANRVSPPDIAWQPSRDFVDIKALEGVDAVINLAGEPIAQLWTAKRKATIRNSRVATTALLAQSLARLSRRPRVLLSGSAIGIYGDRGEEELDESSALSSDFLATTAEAWECAATPASQAGIRVVLLRTGIVLGPSGGALAKMLVPFRLGLGGRVGSGEQWMSWIGREDWVRAVRFLLTAESLSGPVNLVAPNPVSNAEFGRTLARVLGRPALGRVPAAVVNWLLGEMGRSTLLTSQRVRPRRLMEAGFEFTHPTLEQSLRAELARPSAAR